MTIASEITKLNTNLTNAYTAVDGKGGTLPSAQNFDNLATAISSIPSGSGIGISREVKNGVYQMPTENFTFSLPNDATIISEQYALAYAFYGCTGLTSVDLSALTTVSGGNALSYAFYGCINLTSADLSSLTTISGTYPLSYIFRNCTGLTSVDLSALTTILDSGGIYYAFGGCTNLTSVNFPALTTVSAAGGLSYVFNGCTALTSVSFPALTTTSFGSNKNQFSNMMYNTGTSKTHTIHFPSNMQSTISGLSGYPLFSGKSGYVVCAFDLPATS